MGMKLLIGLIVVAFLIVLFGLIGSVLYYAALAEELQEELEDFPICYREDMQHD